MKSEDQVRLENGFCVLCDSGGDGRGRFLPVEVFQACPAGWKPCGNIKASRAASRGPSLYVFVLRLLIQLLCKQRRL